MLRGWLWCPSVTTGQQPTGLSVDHTPAGLEAIITFSVAATKGRNIPPTAVSGLDVWRRTARGQALATIMGPSSLWMASRRSAATARPPPSFEDRKLACLKDMFKHRKDLLAMESLESLEYVIDYVKEDIGKKHNVAMSSHGVSTLLKPGANYTESAFITEFLHDRFAGWKNLHKHWKCPNGKVNNNKEINPWAGLVERSIPLTA